MGERLPWYDSGWLGSYMAAKAAVARHHPGKLSGFVEAFDKLRTRPDFSVQKLAHVFDAPTMTSIREAVRTLEFNRLELHEAELMGRVIVHNHPLFTKLQGEIVPLVSALAGEPVEPLYNFLSLYSTLGVCPVHMDAPEAKWTLDLCIDQSEAWPIHFSDIVPWPEDEALRGRSFEQWQKDLRSAAGVPFRAFTLEPGEALLFSGSSQWHFRDPIPDARPNSFCNLLFFHFIPKGSEPLIRPENWAGLFAIPEIAEIGSQYARSRT